MIVEFDSQQDWVQDQATALRGEGLASSIQVTVARHEAGFYVAQLTRVRTTPTSVQGVSLGQLSDVPVGARRCTWLLTEAVQRALYDPQAHSLLHW